MLSKPVIHFLFEKEGSAVSGLLHPETLPEYLSDKFIDLLLRFREDV